MVRNFVVTMKNQKHKVVIACRSLKPELEKTAVESSSEAELIFLDQELHRTPDKMPAEVQQAVDDVKDTADEIVLGYGLCSNGIVGVTAPPQGLIVPKVHDCITLFLGARNLYRQAFKENPGTYYLTPGWIDEQKDPLGIMENDYTPRMGKEFAEWGIKEELKNYTHIVFVSSTAAREQIENLRKRARDNACFLEKQFEEVEGQDAYFRKILNGPYNEEDFIFFKGGQKITQSPFLSL